MILGIIEGWLGGPVLGWSEVAGSGLIGSLIVVL